MAHDLPSDADTLRHFGAGVRELRVQRGWSQEELANRSGLHRTYVSDVERGERNISLVNIVRLARALAVPPALLLGSCGPSEVASAPETEPR